MAGYCTIHPRRNNRSTGELQDSKLHKDILSLTHDRSLTNQMYATAVSSRFKNEWQLNNGESLLEIDELGEPTLESLIGNTDLLDSDFSDVLTKSMAREHELLDDSGELLSAEETAQGIHNLTSKAAVFNEKSRFRDKVKAIVEKIHDGVVQIVMKKATPDTNIKANNQKAAAKLNAKIRSYLSSNGVRVEALDDLETRLGTTGLITTETDERAANGIATIIKIAQGQRGEEALPEEFAHFIVESLQDKPAIQRLLKMMSDRQLAISVIGDDAYADASDNELSHEAVARLVMSSILQGNNIKADDVWARLMSVATNDFASIFGKMNASEITSMIDELHRDIDTISQAVWDMKLSPVLSEKQFRHVNAATKKLSEVFRQMLSFELSRYATMRETYQKQSRAIRKRSLQEQDLFINDLRLQQASGLYLSGITKIVDKALHECKDIKSAMTSIGRLPLSERSAIINDARNRVASHRKTIQLVFDTLIANDTINSLSQYGYRQDVIDSLISAVNQTLTITAGLELSIKNIGTEIFAAALGGEISDGQTYSKQGVMTELTMNELRQLIRTMPEDVSKWNEWVMQPALINDPIIQLTSTMIKHQQNQHKADVNAIGDRIRRAHRLLREAGITDESWMFERDENGNLTYNYISEVSYAAYDKAYQEVKAEIEAAYDKSDPTRQTKIEKELFEWIKANTDYDKRAERRTPAKAIYSVNTLNNLSNVQRAYYDEIMNIRADLVAALPDNIYAGKNGVYEGMRAVQIRKSLVNRIQTSDLNSMPQQLWKSMSDTIMRRSDDSEYAYSKATFNVAGEMVKSLPIYFTGKVESSRDLSTEVSSTMLAFASTSMYFKRMNEIVDILENGRAILSERTSLVNQGGKQQASVRDVSGRTVITPGIKQDLNATNVYDKLLDMQLYGNRYNDAGTFGNSNIDKRKSANALMAISSVTQLGLNLTAGIAAVFNDMIQVNNEVLAHQYFTFKELHEADKAYFKELFKRTKEMNDELPTSKVRLFQNKFDLLQQFDHRNKYNNMERSRFAKLFNLNSLFCFMNAGADFGQTRTAIAQAMHTKLIDSNGNAISLWDALDVKYYDAAGRLTDTDQGYGATLELKQGVKNQDGSDITDFTMGKFAEKFKGLNQRLFGVYNKEDANALQTTIVGSMVMMYRKYLIPQLDRRYGKQKYDPMLEQETEGFYRTFWRYLKGLVSSAKETGTMSALVWDSMTEYEKSNVRRALSELATMLTMTLFSSFVVKPNDWGKKESPWMKRMIAYQSTRIRTEIGALLPTGIGGDTFQIIKSPAASVDVIESVWKLMEDIFKLPSDLVYIMSDNEDKTSVIGEGARLQSGRYKGRTRFFRDFMKSPFMPFHNQAYRFLNPQENNVYYNQ